MERVLQPHAVLQQGIKDPSVAAVLHHSAEGLVDLFVDEGTFHFGQFQFEQERFARVVDVGVHGLLQAHKEVGQRVDGCKCDGGAQAFYLCGQITVVELSVNRSAKKTLETVYK